MIAVFITIIGIFFIIFFIYKKCVNHYWYNVMNGIENKSQEYYSSADFKNNSIIETNINNINLNLLVDLYKNYYPSFSISEKKI